MITLSKTFYTKLEAYNFIKILNIFNYNYFIKCVYKDEFTYYTIIWQYMDDCGVVKPLNVNSYVVLQVYNNAYFILSTTNDTYKGILCKYYMYKLNKYAYILNSKLVPSPIKKYIFNKYINKILPLLDILFVDNTIHDTNNYRFKYTNNKYFLEYE